MSRWSPLTILTTSSCDLLSLVSLAFLVGRSCRTKIWIRRAFTWCVVSPGPALHPFSQIHSTPKFSLLARFFMKETFIQSLAEPRRTHESPNLIRPSPFGRQTYSLYPGPRPYYPSCKRKHDYRVSTILGMQPVTGSNLGHSGFCVYHLISYAFGSPK